MMFNYYLFWFHHRTVLLVIEVTYARRTLYGKPVEKQTKLSEEKEGTEKKHRLKVMEDEQRERESVRAQNKRANKKRTIIIECIVSI